MNKVINTISENEELTFPVYTNDCYGNHKASLTLDLETGEIDYHIWDRNSCTEREWKGIVTNLFIDNRFLSDKDLHDFVEENISLINDIFVAGNENYFEINPNLLDKLYESSQDWCDNRSFYDDFNEYRQLCGITIEEDMKTYDTDEPESYAEELWNTDEQWFMCSLNSLKQDVKEYYEEYIK